MSTLKKVQGDLLTLLLNTFAKVAAYPVSEIISEFVGEILCLSI
jgi:hypothetical protein